MVNHSVSHNEVAIRLANHAGWKEDVATKRSLFDRFSSKASMKASIEASVNTSGECFPTCKLKCSLTENCHINELEHFYN